MLKFNVGVPRPAQGEAHTARITAANELVKRTLAQHGLMPGGDLPMDGAAPVLPTMEDLLARFQSPLSAPTPSTPIPDGATFALAQFSCKSGSRAYRTYVPSTAAQGVAGIVVMLHGCTQNPLDFAAGTGMNALAEQHRFIVVYPEQARGNNAQSCWNWFSRGDQQRDRGEPAILAGITRKIMAEYGVLKAHTFVAGLSAGAAMAVILGETYPDVYAAVGAHSGLPFGAATDVASAFAAMAGTGPAAECPSGAKSAVRTIVFHGTADTTVNPTNGKRIARHALTRGPDQMIEMDESGQVAGRHFSRQIVTEINGGTMLEHWTIDGLGHAWSGGQPQGSYTDAKGPDASAEMIRFFFASADKSD